MTLTIASAGFSTRSHALRALHSRPQNRKPRTHRGKPPPPSLHSDVPVIAPQRFWLPAFAPIPSTQAQMCVPLPGAIDSSQKNLPAGQQPAPNANRARRLTSSSEGREPSQTARKPSAALPEPDSQSRDTRWHKHNLTERSVGRRSNARTSGLPDVPQRAAAT